MYLLRNISRLKIASNRNLWLLPQKTCHKNFLFKNTPSIYNYNNHVRLKNTEVKKCNTEVNTPPVSVKEKLKKAVAEYGSTVIVFHVSISLVSLGVCYTLISSGVDVSKLMGSVGISGETATRVATNAGTFAVAYAVHKVFAPVRVGITLTATPFIVRYFRQIGILKPVKP